MRILDMGCGKAMSSIFLVKEFGIQVWANDPWLKWEKAVVAAGKSHFPSDVEVLEADNV